MNDQCAICSHNFENCELGLFPSAVMDCPWFKTVGTGDEKGREAARGAKVSPSTSKRRKWLHGCFTAHRRRFTGKNNQKEAER